MVIATRAFSALAHSSGHGQGLLAPRIVEIPHPIGGVPDATLDLRADAALDAVLHCLRAD